MNNDLLNKIGLSALVLSAMIAISSLGYTMAAANQANISIEEPAHAQVIALSDQKCQGKNFKWLTWDKVSSDEIADKRG